MHMSSQRRPSAIQEGFDALFLAAVIAMVVGLFIPSLRTNTALLVGGPIGFGVIVATLDALGHAFL